MLEATALRLERHGQTALSATFSLRGPHAVVVGAPALFFEALFDASLCAAGGLRWASAAPLRAQRLVSAPPRWSAREWVEWRLKLSGVSAREASRLAFRSFELFGLQSYVDARLDVHATGRGALRAVLPLLAALVDPTQPEAPIVLDESWRELDDRAAMAFQHDLVQAAGGRPWLAVLPWIDGASPLFEAATEVLVFELGALRASGAPAEVRSALPR